MVSAFLSSVLAVTICSDAIVCAQECNDSSRRRIFKLYRVQIGKKEKVAVDPHRVNIMNDGISRIQSKNAGYRHHILQALRR